MRNDKLIDALFDCVAKCNYCADACLDEQDIKMMVKCIRLDRICAETCAATAKILTVDASKKDVKALVDFCEEICRKCGEECAKHETQHCKDCAEACKRCVEACASF